ncbi:MAG: ATP-binding protein [Chloroflexota bacterium]|nr:ATP-binding protein [Chloroflexota bacterium]
MSQIPQPTPQTDPLAAHTLAAREVCFQTMIEGMLDAVYILHSVRDASGEIIDFKFAYVNREGERQMNNTRAAMIGQYMCELYPLNRTNEFFDHYKHVVESGETLEQEYFIPIDAEGRSWWYHQVVKVGDGVSISNRDISPRKALEAQLLAQERQIAQAKQHALERLKTDMMVRIAHEFRTPLTRIGLSGDMLERYWDRLTPDQVAVRVHDMKTEIVKLEGMLSALNFAVVGRDTTTEALMLTAVDVSALCRDVSARFRNTHRQQDRLMIDCLPLPAVQSDPNLLNLIFLNLIANAIKFSANNAPVYVHVMRMVDTLIIEVRDQGIGIMPDDLPRIFDPFFRGHNFDETPGLGIGLTSVKNAVDMLDGQIVVTSIAAPSSVQGTTVRVIIPARWTTLDG